MTLHTSDPSSVRARSDRKNIVSVRFSVRAARTVKRAPGYRRNVFNVHNFYTRVRCQFAQPDACSSSSKSVIRNRRTLPKTYRFETRAETFVDNGMARVRNAFLPIAQPAPAVGLENLLDNGRIPGRLSVHAYNGTERRSPLRAADFCRLHARSPRKKRDDATRGVPI